MEGMPYKRTKIEKEKKRELEKLVLRTISPIISAPPDKTVKNSPVNTVSNFKKVLQRFRSLVFIVVSYL